jgi:hypothetical protein
MPTETLKGSCLCGAVKFEVTPPLSGFRYCHCSRCQKASGSAHAANIFLPQGQMKWLAGEKLITKFDVPDAKRFSVWFCSKCGTRVPHQIRTTDNYLVPAGVLDQDPEMRPQNSIFWDSHAPWYVEPHEIQKFSEYS